MEKVYIKNGWKKSFAILTMALAIVLLGKISVKAANIPDGYVPIYSIEDLYGINENLQGNYILMNDIDLSSTKTGGDWDSGNGWTPIGADSSNEINEMTDLTYYEDFDGVFDGNGHRIKNMTIYGDEVPSCLGLFASIGDGTVKNLALEDIDISVGEYGTYCIGGIAGNNFGTIESCYVTGTIQCINAEHIGGIVGNARSGNGRSTVQNCYSDVNIDVPDEYFRGHIGGVVGYNCSGYIINCYAIGEIQCISPELPQENVGAIAGFDSDEIYAYGHDLGEKNCYYLGKQKDYCAKRLSVAQMKSSKCFTKFDFNKTWVIDKNSAYSYPQLKNCMQVRTNSIELLSEPDKLEYYTTDQLDLEGSELKINYEDDYSVTIPLTENMLSYDMVEGTQKVFINYNSCEESFDIIVKKAPETLKVISKKTKLKLGEKYRFQVKYVGDGKVTYSTSNSRILKINKKSGISVAQKAGVVKITVKAGALTKKIKVRVVK